MTAGRPTAEAAAETMPDVDRELLAAAREVLSARYVRGHHEVAAAARTATGAILTGLHVEASQGRASICAEGGIVSAAAAAGEDIVSVVAVLRRTDGRDYLIEPCGVCAELLAEVWTHAQVWVGWGDEPRKVPITDLLPFRHTRVGRLPDHAKENPAP